MDMLKGGSDIALADMLNGMSDIADIADMALLSDMLVGRGNWSGLRQPLIGSGCSIPGTKPGLMKPGWEPMKPIGPPGKKSDGCPGNRPP